jgi:hypothetical protein
VGCNNYYSSASTNKYIETDAASRLAFDNAGNMTFYVAPSGTAGNAISWTTAMTIANGGNVTVNTGNLVIGTSGKGIDFSANGNAAGMTSEVLDDYEEGTWTPTFYNITAAANIPATYDDTRYGNYTKIGRTVTLNVFLRTDAITLPATAADFIGIGGLPFTITSVGEHSAYPAARWLVPASNWATIPRVASIGASEAFIRLYTSTSAGAGETTLASNGNDFAAGGNSNSIAFTVTYQV